MEGVWPIWYSLISSAGFAFLPARLVWLTLLMQLRVIQLAAVINTGLHEACIYKWVSYWCLDKEHTICAIKGISMRFVWQQLRHGSEVLVRAELVAQARLPLWQQH